MDKCQLVSWHLLKIVPGTLPLMFGHNTVSDSWDIADMDKCHQDICCLDKCHLESWHLLKIVPGTLPLKFVKIWSVTDDLLLSWTNVTRKYVAWINVTMTVGIS